MPLPLPNKTFHIAKLLAPSVQKSAKARKAALECRAGVAVDQTAGFDGGCRCRRDSRGLYLQLTLLYICGTPALCCLLLLVSLAA